jgi:tetratricopeptide (TPR) repeat protein
MGPRVLVALLAARRGDNEQAVNTLRVAEELVARANQYSLSRIALIYSLAGEPQQAQRVFDLLVQRDGRLRADLVASPAAWVIAYMAIGDYEEALTRLVEAIDRNEAGDFVLLNEIRTNFFGDPVLDNDSRFIAERARLRFNE